MPKRPNPTISPIEIPSGSVSFDANAFDEFLNAHGIRLVHYKAMRCPVGLTDVDDNRRPHEDHSSCSNGFLYHKAGIVTAAMQGNSNNQFSNELGLVENSYITVSFPQFYDDSDIQVAIAPFDRFFLCESEKEQNILVPTWHLQIMSQSGIDKLLYPVEKVEYLVDSHGTSFVEGVDFEVTNGKIDWSACGKNPGYQMDVRRGTVYSVRFLYRPYWYCVRMLHEIRVAQTETFDGRELIRMPQQVLLAREHVFTNQQNDSKNPDKPRQTPEPNDGW